jgi:hypothetical protein
VCIVVAATTNQRNERMRILAIIVSALLFIVAVWSGFDGEFMNCALASLGGGVFAGVASMT